MFVWRVFPGRANARPGAFLTLPALERHGIHAAFTTRTGGMSGPPVESLNLTYLAGDDPVRVSENRAAVIERLGAGAWTGGQQVHGSEVAHVGPAEAGRGATDPDDTLRGVDAMWTDEPGAALAVLTADCVPLFLADVRGRRIAVVHAGWRGLVGGVVEKAARTLADAGSNLDDTHAFIGPSIGPCHFEVGDDVASPAREALGDHVAQKRDGAWFVDLWEGTRSALHRAGIRAVWPSRLCTRCEPHRFYSHRAGSAGRQGLVAVIA